MLVAGVDSSTQSTKVILCDADDGTIVAQASAPHPGGTECPPQAWWEALTKAGDGLLTRAAAVGVAGQQHGMVVLDSSAEVIRPALLWNDLRSAAAASALVEERGPRWWAERTGSVPNASFTVTKLRWLAEHEPGNAARVNRVMLPHDFLTWLLAAGPQLAEEPVTDRGDASGTGYFSPADSAWLPEVAADALGHEVRLPRLARPAEAVGETPLGAVVSAGTGDNMGAALGLGLEPGEIAVSIGTSGTAYAVTTVASADPSGAIAGFADATGRFLPLVRSCGGVHAIAALAAQFGIDMARLDQLALGSPAGARGVRLVPFDDADDSLGRLPTGGRLTGLRADTTQEDVARALVEGVVCTLLDGLDRLRAADVPVGGRLFVQGYAARSHAFQRTLADLSERTIYLPHTTDVADTSALGACVQAASMLYQVDPAELANVWGLEPTRVVEPDYAVDADAIRADYTVPRAA